MPLKFSGTQDTPTRLLQKRLAERGATRLRIRSTRQFDVRSAPAMTGSKISGLCVPYDSLSHVMTNWGGEKFRERYARGCFRTSLTDPDLQVCFNHDPSMVIGTVGRGTARFDEQDDGLYCEADPPNTSWCRDLIESMKRGDICRMSAGFYVVDEAWSTERGQLIRTVRSGTLIEASVVNRAAYPATQAAVEDFEEVDSDDGDDELAEDLLAEQDLMAVPATINHQPRGELSMRSARRQDGETELARARRELDALEQKLDPLAKYRREIAAMR
jgi:HK97 family phage prohead protease